MLSAAPDAAAPANGCQCQLWHRAGRAVVRLDGPAGDEDARRRDPTFDKHVEYRPSDPGEIDDDLRVPRQFAKKSPDMGEASSIGAADAFAA
jgi:hypothetical protein